jgi:hypothetical protein
MKKTNWYPPHIKPVRVGLYEVGSDIFYLKAYWSGKSWRLALNKDQKWKIQNLTWRGLTHEPH